MLWWSNYSAKSIALIQARGIPIDTALWNLVQENKQAVIAHLLRKFDPSHGDDDPIYTPDGEWSYSRFERWLVRAGITAWPRLNSGALNIDSDAFRLMYHLPGIEGLQALRDSVDSSPERGCRSGAMVATALRFFRSALLRDEMRIAVVHTTHTHASGRSSSFHLTRSESISIGEVRRSALPQAYLVIKL